MKTNISHGSLGEHRQMAKNTTFPGRVGMGQSFRGGGGGGHRARPLQRQQHQLWKLPPPLKILPRLKWAESHHGLSEASH